MNLPKFVRRIAFRCQEKRLAGLSKGGETSKGVRKHLFENNSVSFG